MYTNYENKSIFLLIFYQFLQTYIKREQFMKFFLNADGDDPVIIRHSILLISKKIQKITMYSRKSFKISLKIKTVTM